MSTTAFPVPVWVGAPPAKKARPPTVAAAGAPTGDESVAVDH
jgi:hypothetical protein